MESAKQMKEDEEVKESDLKSKSRAMMEAEGIDQYWKNKVREILTLLKEISKSYKGRKIAKSRRWTTARRFRETVGSRSRKVSRRQSESCRRRAPGRSSKKQKKT